MNIAAGHKHEEMKDSRVDWLGEIPAPWSTHKLKFVVKILKRIAGHEGPSVLSITQQGIKIKDIESGEGQLAQDYSGYQIVDRGDFAMNHMDLLTGYVDISKFDGVVSPDYRVFRNFNPEVLDEYLLLIFQIGYTQKIFFRYGQGVSLLGRWRLPADNFNEFEIPVPPKDQQRKIIDFLKEKAATIDEAVRIKEAQIKLLAERRQILIQQAVTRGLNPDAPMKDSGIDWIGQIPAHWEVLRGKHRFREINERSEEGTEELLSVSHTTGVTARSEKNVNMFLAEDYTGSKLCQPGDIVINTMWAWMGALGVSDITGIISPSYGVYRPLQKDAFNRRFLEWLLRTTPFIEQYNKISTGLHSSRLRLYPHMFLGLPMAFPLRDEQDAIVARVENESMKIDKAISIKEDQITALTEYKTSLINAAVTGKIKVI